MTQVTIINIFEKIRSICKQCNFNTLPEKIVSQDNIPNLQSYLKTLDNIRIELIKFNRLEQEYTKLEALLQKQETQLRRRIGIENQMKIYIEILKQQMEQSEQQKIDFRENTKTYIKQLKKVNQNLFIQIAEQVNKNKASLQYSNEKKTIKEKISEINKSLNKNRPKRDRSIKEIVKTEYIQRQKFHTDTKKQRKVHRFKLHSSIISDSERQNIHLEQNLKTFQEHNISTGRKIKNKPDQLIKNNPHFVSNQTINNFFDQSKVSTRKHDKDKHIKSPKAEKKQNLTKNRGQILSKHPSKERRHNRSVYSVLSAEHSENKKQFF